MCGEDVNTNGKQGLSGLVIAVVCLFFGLFLTTFIFYPPFTSLQGFTSDAVPTINDDGDIDCGGSGLRVILRGPRVAVPPGDLARRAENACRDGAVTHVWFSVVGLVFVTAAGSLLVLRARRHRARRRAEGPGDSGDRAVPDVPLLESGTFVRTD